MSIDRADQFDGDRQRAFMVELAEGQPFALRIADALLRTGNLCKNLDQSWINTEVRREVFELGATPTSSTACVRRRSPPPNCHARSKNWSASLAESSLDRAAVGQIKSTESVLP
ncbi:MAG: hypothetical protein U5L03_09280 [Burkholderiaceae bacterium]|nr:hypothetical protein [Burkholderiaceae bacterium]